MDHSRNPSLSGRSRRQGSTHGAPGNGNRVTKNASSPPQRRRPEAARFGLPSPPSTVRARASRNSFDYEWSSSVASSDVGVDENYAERYDEHSSYEIDMNATYDECEDVLAESHTEMYRRLVTEPFSTVTDTISKHLDLVTPPNSPSLTTPSPKSPVTEEILKRLQEKTLAELVRSDKESHDQLQELYDTNFSSHFSVLINPNDLQ